MNIITGKTGAPHVTAQQDREINSAIFGLENYVLPIGQKFAYELSSSNTVRIKDGMLVMQGCCASIDAGAYEELTVSNGTQGMGRIDLICAKYSKTTSNGNESVELIIVKGTPGETPTTPELSNGIIRDGALVAYFPLYSVRIDGVSIQSITPLFEALERNLSGKQKLLWKGAYYMNSSQTISLSEKVSEQIMGIELVFAPYSNGEVLRRNLVHFTVSKEFVQNHDGHSSSFIMVLDQFKSICHKQLYIFDNKIMGLDINSSKGTANGITYDNTSFVLTEIYGV